MGSHFEQAERFESSLGVAKLGDSALSKNDEVQLVQDLVEHEAMTVGLAISATVVSVATVLS